ncbi:MAG: RluA family pseudouridine synthase [Phycisphaerae bacterium]|nr:RluA family pseudouridine synthase [Phycisphaerae bacterium]NIS51666.1 RluA family pseudouridine synthase [Phycisphaerae bacterium]NIU09257.1 RluA family pseudouridine synthase [Phycisphaerae bacterium]NIU56918.1 RluA family pseudouridine synthase [Phycisphaerae bacterium]NIW93370.1 RluA family pseudouridine synthase [Phycisphaerae bacterium]
MDKYLHGRFSNFSRAMIQRQIGAGGVKVNGKIVKPSFKLSPGDTIDLTLPQLPSKEIEPEDIPLNIIYEDEDIIVLNKQADMVVHPARSNTHGTLVNALAFYADKLSSGLGEFRPGIVHRLDKDTTGVMVATKNEGAQWRIAKQFERRQVDKSYLAIVHGVPELTADRISAPLGMHPRVREKYAIRPGIGKESITFYEVVESFRGFSLLKLTPKTGRTHQIRVHLSYIKHPIVADDMYGGKLVYPWQLKDAETAVEEPIISRFALHASTLEFKHPTTEKVVKFEAPLHEDMQNLLDMLRKYRKS